jgi:hypothetical protein
MDNKLKKSGQRATPYWWADGLAELSAGVICLILAGLNSFLSRVPWTPLTSLIFFLVVFGSAYGIRRGMLHIKERSTYPRTGYVAPKSWREDRVGVAVAIVFTVLLMALMLFLVMTGSRSLVWMTAGIGLILGFIFGWAGYQTGLWRLYFLAAFCLVAGFGLSISGFGDFAGAAILLALTSLVLFAFGGLTRWAYLHHTSPLPGESNGD